MKRHKKISSVSTEYDIDTTISPPPLPPDDDGDDWGNDDINPDMEKKIKVWIYKNINEIGKDIVPTIVKNIEPEISIANQYKDVLKSIQIKGHGVAKVYFTTKDNSQIWQNIIFDIKNKLKNSKMWRDIGVPYEKSYKIMNNIKFDEILEFSVISSVSALNNINYASLWAFDNKKNIEKKIVNYISRNMYSDIINKDKIKLSFYTKPSSYANNSTTLDDNANVINLNVIIISVIPYEFEYPKASITVQKEDGNDFERLDYENKINILGAFDAILERESEKIDRDKYNNIDNYDEEKYKLKDIYSHEDGKTFADYDNIQEILNNIPKNISLSMTTDKKKKIVTIIMMKVVGNELIVAFDIDN